ncbi:bifunctional isocitrate dehydrogenase kinase/phosphatase [Pusillimonas noertemannii]|uniref:Isocitrate dehydrogenase kinase/phosphatase n=1 Tax=Pusillimonas noertemannii TaxID=305977 RepID=A0A2U1CGZ2_9BURK|nr:bifunctional isocitrate dehydrogenase kinase/phosphatase [Pusillimonas noertemannii]NYT70398.1 bifunctional isocitrate dehydrogenase kinase/phosphatase [Pusillimonas noertemannii]PVY60178.1 isocitrate dehydrogenase kinase/phosphatase [Pusillimonas noertemannii]TFL08607.1 bifunctional isocitrate dehydrogenase kinase/phosphatase [Pusillimonas noertemannii]
MIYTGDHQHIEPVSRQRLSPQDVAQTILSGFDRHYALFRYGAQRAKSLFESGDWRAIQQLSRERIEYYDTRVRECSAMLNATLRGSEASPEGASAEIELTEPQLRFWQAAKAAYIGLLAGHRQPECAETFFNSVSCRILHRDYFNNDFMFVRPAVATDYIDSRLPSYRVYYPATEGLQASLIRMMADFGLAAPFADLPRDVRALARMAVGRLRATLTREAGQRIAPDCQIHVLNSLFFRNKGAYAVGRLVNQGAIHPFAIALLRQPSGHVELDALLYSTDDLSTLFSFTRAYFLVDMEAPSAYVHFLNTLLPRKPKAEIYTTIGLQKQGKTLFYRDFLHHLAHSRDAFDLAPGIKGLVMAVFTLPSYPYVFKLIRDRIAKPDMDSATVKRKYQMVKKHDRVGRMADTWEYSQVALPRERFSEALLQELRREVPGLLEETPDTIVLRHVYIERRMTPLNIYLMRASDAALEDAVRQYGDAIRELAAANIFPGDMLFKNFGVTRLGRVVFYDYDEIQRMTEMNFRRIPPAPYEEAELAAEPWYPVGPNDVFPEEFDSFLLGNPRVRAAFLKHHACLLDAEWWQACRERVIQGRIEDIFPYDASRRLGRDARGPAAMNQP